jgi:hypothetical protein
VFPWRAAFELGGLAALQEAREHILQPCCSEILNVWPVLVVGMEQRFVQASPIKYFATSGALREVLLFFGRKLSVFVECHCAIIAVDPDLRTWAGKSRRRIMKGVDFDKNRSVAVA